MERLQHIQAEVAALPVEELHRFHSWFEDFIAKRWDEELEGAKREKAALIAGPLF